MLKNNLDITKQSSPSSNTAILMIDVISDFEFEDGEELFEHALPVAENLAKFKKEAKSAGIPVIYVNDNHGRWGKDFDESAEKLIKSGKRGSKIAEILRPEKQDYHIIKPQRSGFYATPLGAFLISVNISNLIITGVTTDICVLLTGLEAQMRGYHVHVPTDCTAAVKPEYHKDAIRFLARVAEADTRPCSEIDLEKLAGQFGTDPSIGPSEAEPIKISTESKIFFGNVGSHTDGMRETEVSSYQ